MRGRVSTQRVAWTSAVLTRRGEQRVGSGPDEELAGYRPDADSVEMVLAGCRESDWTAEVVTSSIPTNEPHTKADVERTLQQPLGET